MVQVVRAIASHQCGRGSNPGVNTTCGLSLLFILAFALKGFFGVFQFSPLLKNQHFQIPIQPRMVVKDLNHYVCGLLSVNSQGLLHPVTRRSRRSHWQSFIPLQTSLSSVNLSFFSRTIIQWNNLLSSVFSEHCSLDTFKAQVAAIIYLFISLLHCKLTLFFWLTNPANDPQM